MGWKANVIFASEDPGYFSTLPAHDPKNADALRNRLGLARFESAGASGFEMAMYPQSGHLYIGAYPRGVILCESELPCALFDSEAQRNIVGSPRFPEGFTTNLLGLYPRGQVLAAVLHSVVDLWAYSLYVNGQHVRTAAGASDDGLVANQGALLPEETRLLDGRSFQEVQEEGLGEDLVFEVMSRFLGARLDTLDSFNPAMSVYTRRARSPLAFIKNMFNRS